MEIRKATLVGLLGEFGKLGAKLAKFAESKQVDMATRRAKIQDLNQLQATDQQEHDRAVRISAKLEELLK